MSGNKKKNALLGMNHSTASSRLKKMLLWKYVCKAGENICFQCGEKIESIDDLSIEHKEPWQSAESPILSFFDPKNIAFSHLSCNSAAGKKVGHRGTPRETDNGLIWCPECKRYLPKKDFTLRQELTKDKQPTFRSYCSKCRYARKKAGKSY
jgi:hypothetical protein